jgi:hypothetical protein
MVVANVAVDLKLVVDQNAAQELLARLMSCAPGATSCARIARFKGTVEVALRCR